MMVAFFPWLAVDQGNRPGASSHSCHIVGPPPLPVQRPDVLNPSCKGGWTPSSTISTTFRP